MHSGKPTILLLGDTLNVGGTEKQFVEVACRLDRSQWNVCVSCLRPEGPLRQTLEAAGVYPWKCGRGSFKSPRFLAAVWALSRYLRDRGICVVHAFDLYSNILGIPAARLAKVPAVIASQRACGDCYTPFQRRLLQWSLWLADYVLVNSEAVAKELQWGQVVPSKHIAFIPNGVDLSRFVPTSRRRCRSHPIVIGTLTNLRPEKGLEHFVRAAALVHKHYPTGRFAIWGKGELRTALERLVHELGLGETVEFRGETAVPEAALRELDIFVLPSLTEASSNALLEAMATGLPVIATHVGGNSALVKDSVSGLLVPPADPVALAKAILRLIEEPPLATALAMRGQGQIQANFGMDQMLGRIEALYHRALDR